jgi:hypothetical protein
LAGLSFVPEFVVYHELVLTTKHYIHGVTAVDPLWLSQMAPEFFTATDVYGRILDDGIPVCERVEVIEDIEVAEDRKIEVEDINIEISGGYVGDEVISVVLPSKGVSTKRKRLGK